MHYNYKLTILTPTYNRSGLVKQCYNYLCQQSERRIQWLIIDDGSTDNTKEVVNSFNNDSGFLIEYFWKENGGKHTALNYAHDYIKGEFVLILDSDDYLIPSAVEKVLTYIDKYKNDSKIGVFAFRRGYSNGDLIGVFEKKHEFVSDYISYRINENIQGDQCEIIRTDLFKKYSFPVYVEEKFLGEDYLWINVAKECSTLYFNEIIYICEYLPGGLTRSGRRMLVENPLGGMLHGSLYFSKRFKLKYRIKGMMLYVCYALFAKKSLLSVFFETEYKWLFLTVFPLGVLLYFYWMWRYGK